MTLDSRRIRPATWLLVHRIAGEECAIDECLRSAPIGLPHKRPLLGLLQFPRIIRNSIRILILRKQISLTRKTGIIFYFFLPVFPLESRKRKSSCLVVYNLIKLPTVLKSIIKKHFILFKQGRPGNVIPVNIVIIFKKQQTKF